MEDSAKKKKGNITLHNYMVHETIKQKKMPLKKIMYGTGSLKALI